MDHFVRVYFIWNHFYLPVRLVSSIFVTHAIGYDYMNYSLHPVHFGAV